MPKSKIVTSFTLIILLCFQSSCKSSTGPKASGRKEKNAAETVKAEFLHSWNGYKAHAWGHDALRPLSQSFHDWYGESFVMTPVDAFDTMILMGLTNEAREAKALIFDRLNFSQNITIQGFEINIRLLGGLLSAYQLDGDPRFLTLARELGDRLLPVFNSPTGMPYIRVNLSTGATDGKVNNPAEIGTYIVEFGTLSKLTGNPVYYEKAKRALQELYNRRSSIGLVGTTIDVETGVWRDQSSHLSGRIDSYYEYLLKGSLLFDDQDLREMWQKSITAIHTYLADETANGLWYGRADMNTGGRTGTYFGALDAFFPAVLALGGDLGRAGRLQESCFKMWTLHGIEPEAIDYSSMTVIAPNYVLRPENIESAYYLYYYTKDEKYLEMGEVYLDSLVKYCKTGAGYAALRSVITKEKDDQMESFFLAETLKYLYLLFDQENKIDLSNTFFNTEAHPIHKTWQ